MATIVFKILIDFGETNYYQDSNGDDLTFSSIEDAQSYIDSTLPSVNYDHIIPNTD